MDTDCDWPRNCRGVDGIDENGSGGGGGSKDDDVHGCWWSECVDEAVDVPACVSSVW